MKQTQSAMSLSSFETLRRLAQPPQSMSERCELCHLALSPVHRHLLEVETRQVACSCDSCALLFQNAAGTKFKLIPRDSRALTDFQMTDGEWESLALPIDLAFFFYSTPSEKMVALYPSPAGPMESLLPLTSWQVLVKQNPVLQNMQPDVEALLVNRAGVAREYFLAPIDACYELIGTIRMHWRGFSGGEDVWREIENFFARLRANSPTFMLGR